MLDGRFSVTQLMGWFKLLKRVFDLDLAHCPQCGGDLKIIAASWNRRWSRRSFRTWGCGREHRLGRQSVARRCKRPDAAQP